MGFRLVRAALTVLTLLSLLICSEPAPLSGQTPSASAVSRFLARHTLSSPSHRARRHLEARSLRIKRDGWLDAITTSGPDGFTYEVVAEGGSSIVRHKVLRAALDAERRLWADRSAGLTEANYDLAADGIENDSDRIRLTPRRKDSHLVDGWLLVSPDDGELVEIRGRLAKGPSFWTPRVEVVRRYARIAGATVPVSVESTSAVRFVGPSTFAMHYDYEMVNGVDVALH